MPNKMLIDASHPEETRVVVTRGNRIEEFDFESQDKKQLRGNIYLARVTRVEPSLQAAFVEYGGNRHGFLAFSEIHPDYYQIPVADRQALLRAEAEAAKDEEDEDDEPREQRSRATNGRRRRRGRRGRDGEGAKAEGGSADGEVSDADDMRSDDHEDTADSNGAEVEATTSQNDSDADDSNDNGGGSTTMAAAVSVDVVSEPVSSVDDRSSPAEESESGKSEDHVESVGAGDAMDEVRDRRRPPRRHYKIQEVIKRRQILLVQVVKEERGNKGAALTTYLSLAGRYSVLMPNTARGGGISRKITSAQDRKRLKDVVKDLDVPQGMGVILRTAGENRTKAEIKRDYEYLMRMWENVRELTLKSTAPTLVYEEGSLIKRSIRDLYNKDIDEILVAGDDGYREAKDFMRMLMPSHAKMVQPYRDTTPIFARSGLEAQLDRMVQPQVTLKSGGYIIINQTEALVSIDVNSGRSTREHSIEDTALQTNLEAAEEVARQLRLRDLAGLIVIDFIDMEEGRNNRAVEKKLKDCLKNDRARIQVGRISHFGLMEMSRQRIRASVLESTMKPCPHCGGTGHVRSDSSVALMVVRGIEDFLLKDNRHHIVVRTTTATALYVLNHKRGTLVALETKFGVTIAVEADETVGAQHFTILRGTPVENPIDIVEIKPLPFVDEHDHEDDEAVDEGEEEASESADAAPAQARDAKDEASDGNRRRKRRRRRRGGRDRDDAASAGNAGSDDDGVDDQPEDTAAEVPAAAESDVAQDTDAASKKRRRGKRGGRRNREADDIPSEATEDQPVAAELAPEVPVQAEPPVPQADAAEPEPVKPAKKPRRTTKAAKAKAEAASAEAETEQRAVPADPEPAPAPGAEAAPKRPSRRSSSPAPEAATPKVSSTVESDAEQPAPKKGWWQRKSFF